MSFEQLPEALRSLADPTQEVLMDRPAAFSQLAPVPLRHLDSESFIAGESYFPRLGYRRD